MYVMVDCVCAYSPTTSRSKPPLNGIRNIVCVRNINLHVLRIAAFYLEYGKHQNATHRSFTIDPGILSVMSSSRQLSQSHTSLGGCSTVPNSLRTSSRSP